MPTIVNAYNGDLAVGTSRNITITAVTSGNTLLVVFTSSVAVTGVTDNGGSTPTYVADRSTNITGTQYHCWYRRSNITDGPTQVTINLGSSGGTRYTILEVSGLDNASPLGQAATGNTGGFTATPSVTVTTATANELAIALFQASNSRTYTAPVSGTWTRGQHTTDPSNTTTYYDADVGAAGSLTCNPTPDTGTNFYSGMVTYIAASAAANIPEFMHHRRQQGIS